MERNVVLPAPLGPSSPNMPRSRRIETPFRASKPSAYVLAIPSNSIIGTQLPQRRPPAAQPRSSFVDLLADSVLHPRYSLRVGGGKCFGGGRRRGPVIRA